MRKVLVLLLILCAFTAAMVPREKRAVNTEEDHSASATTASSTIPVNSSEKRLCLPNTPCAWSMYKAYIKVIDTYITNNYCICGSGTKCVITEDDKSANSYVHRCREPDSTSDTEFETR